MISFRISALRSSACCSQVDEQFTVNQGGKEAERTLLLRTLGGKSK